MKTHLLAVPSKRSEEVNWLKPLSNYLLSTYGSTSEYTEDLTAFNKLRQDIRGVNADNTGINLYYKYYSQLELLDLRVPFNVVNASKKINFTWHDAFQPSLVNKQGALPFEKANVLFNLGALLSEYAKVRYEESQRSVAGTEEASTKEAIQLFQQAAGIYQFLNENFLHAPSLDLNQSTVKFLVKLMLAQAQEVFVLTVITGDLEGKKNSLVSKLCRSASVHYEECHNMTSYISSLGSNFDDFAVVDSEDLEEDFLDKPDDSDETTEASTSHVPAKLDASWIATVTLKMHYYKSLSYYYNAMNLEAGKKYGDALAYYTKSQDILHEINSTLLRNISKAGSNEAYEILDNYKYQKDAVGIKLTDLTKDNDLIYHEIIPSLVTLPDIKPLDSTKVIPITQNTTFQEINDHNYNNFMSNVVPVNIHELSSFYSEEKSQFLRNELDAVDVSNEEISSVLEYLKLPKALVTIKELINSTENSDTDSSGSSIDPKIEAIANEISSEYANDQLNRQKISQLRKEIYENISQSEEIASKQVSESLTSFKMDLVKIKKSLYDATNSDNQLFGLINDDSQSLYALLGKGSNSEELKNLFKTSSDKSQASKPDISLLDMIDTEVKSPKDQILSQIKVLEDILHDLNVIKANKTKLVETLKKEIHNDDISDILILNSKMKSTNEIKTLIFPEELKKFQPYNEELDKLIQKEKSFVNDLRTEWGKLSSDPEIKNIQSSKASKDQLVASQSARITSFYNDSWKKYSLGLKRGSQFYAGLLDSAINLKGNIQNEADRAAIKPRSSLTSSFDGLSLNQQPPLPPQQHYQQQPQQQTPSAAPGQYEYFDRYSAPQRQNTQPLAAQAPQRSSTGGSFAGYSEASTGGYHRAPPVPPKNIDQQPSGGRSAPPLPPQIPHYGQPSQFHSYAYQQQPSQGNGGNDPNNPNGSNLIYDQPSKYSPNMYNFFSNN
ncbi:protein-tyrosine-phosphatase [Scheffersomyces stipitis CBS 6054]|uniref:BRO domain-containing protein 1 n=1 Tax=Scheffersomyces stipitis (strain ATCC 58785 / CBS 6054 / NBRC 10063 / NRRL Y-11545) TaxID=322104 RepID=A3LNZ7_PICST|nr:protein-tyrosine-phosphatase [Scheffersomyces stipitis CBS 6054]ABN64959.2 protein-tyrosine-phosphatase [Scheffersomyces stipitis CBS 6054]